MEEYTKLPIEVIQMRLEKQQSSSCKEEGDGDGDDGEDEDDDEDGLSGATEQRSFSLWEV